MHLAVLFEIEQLVRAAAGFAPERISEHVGDLALTAVFPAHQCLALAHRHDDVRVLVLMQRLMALGTELDAPDADVLVLEQHPGADRTERITGFR